MPKLVHTTPCGECPFRRISAGGWLGAATPSEFLAAVRSEEHMPCHATIDYERKDWRKQLKTAARCAGSLIYMKNSGQLPRDTVLRAAREMVARDTATVFVNCREFLEHHERIPCED
jgi:hypothetical protein